MPVIRYRVWKCPWLKGPKRWVLDIYEASIWTNEIHFFSWHDAMHYIDFDRA